MRCCLQTISNYIDNNDELPPDGTLIDCEYEEKGNQAIYYNRLEWSVNMIILGEK